jgi:hypothetical protein
MGRLCLEVEPNFADRALRSFHVPGSSNLPNLPISGLGTDREMSMIDSLTFEQFHRICYWYLCTSLSQIRHDEIQLGTIVSLHGENVQEIAHIPNIPFTDRGWKGPWTEDGPRVLINMENGWSRYVPSFFTQATSDCLHVSKAAFLLCEWINDPSTAHWLGHRFRLLAFSGKSCLQSAFDSEKARTLL